LLETFYNRLRDLCGDYGKGNGLTRTEAANVEAKYASSLAGEFGILVKAGQTFASLRESESRVCGAEHLVDFNEDSGRLVKITIPPNFGLIPAIVSTPRANLRDDPEQPNFRQQIEFIPATPLEYLQRWLIANEVFEDDVTLKSVIEWEDGAVSFSIDQPQYNGELPTQDEIEVFLTSSGWKSLPKAFGHALFYNYAFGVLAIDALPRNCYMREGNLLPFDVILNRPDETLQKFLRLF